MILLLLATGSCTGPQSSEQLREILWGATSGYEQHTRPNVAAAIREERSVPMLAQPDNVTLHLHLNQLTRVEEIYEHISLGGYLSAEWYDDRLRFNDSSSGGCFRPKAENSATSGAVAFSKGVLNQIWTPDLMLRNGVGGSTTNRLLDGDYASMWLNPDGHVFAQAPVSLSVTCNMDFTKVPFDQHRCSIIFGVYREDARDVRLLLATPSIDEDDFDARSVSGWKFELAPEESHADVALSGLAFDDFDADAGVQELPIDEEPRATFVFLLRRDSSLVPVTIRITWLLVLISWTGFFIDRSAAPARVALDVIGLLSIIQLLRTTTDALPRRGSLCWLELYLWMSVLFIAFAIVEYGMLLWLMRCELKCSSKEKLEHGTTSPGLAEADAAVAKKLDELDVQLSDVPRRMAGEPKVISTMGDAEVRRSPTARKGSPNGVEAEEGEWFGEPQGRGVAAPASRPVQVKQQLVELVHRSTTTSSTFVREGAPSGIQPGQKFGGPAVGRIEADVSAKGTQRLGVASNEAAGGAHEHHGHAHAKLKHSLKAIGKLSARAAAAREASARAAKAIRSSRAAAVLKAEERSRLIDGCCQWLYLVAYMAASVGFYATSNARLWGR